MPFSLLSSFKRQASPTKKAASQPPRTYRYPKVLSKDPIRPLGRWHVKPDDDQKFLDVVMPYMVPSLRKEHLLQSFLDKHVWAKEFLEPELAGEVGDATVSFHQAAAEFW